MVLAVVHVRIGQHQVDVALELGGCRYFLFGPEVTYYFLKRNKRTPSVILERIVVKSMGRLMIW